MANTKEFSLPEEKTIVKIKPIKRVRGKFNEITKDHLANFIFGPGKRHYMANLSNGNPLTKKEQEFFEDSEKSGLPFKRGELSHILKENNYWKDVTNRVSLDERGITLDLSLSEDYLIYKWLLSNKDEFAEHPDVLEGATNKKTFKWVAVPEEYKDTKAVSKYNKQKEIFKFLGKVENDKTAMINFLLVAEPKKFVSSSTKSEFLVAELNQLAEKNSDKFIQILHDEDRDIKATIRRGLKCRAILQDGISYTTDTGDIIGNNMQDAIKFLKNVENQNVLDIIEAKIEKSKI